MDQLVANGYFLKIEKCEFAQDKITYLGVIIKYGRISMDPKKVKAIEEWPLPKCGHGGIGLK